MARKARALGLTAKPWVKTSFAPGSKVVTDYLDDAGLIEDLEALGFYTGRLRLHHLHRQLGTAPRPDQRGHPQPRPGGHLGAVGQPQLRGTDLPRRPGQLPGLAAPGGRLCHRRDRGHRSGHRAARDRPRRRSRLPDGHLAHPGRDRRDRRTIGVERPVPRAVRLCVRGLRGVEGGRGVRRRPLRVGSGEHLHPGAAVLHRPGPRGQPDRADPGRPGPAEARRLGDHRPHQPGRLDRPRHPGRPLPDRTGGGAGRCSTPTGRGAATTG